MPTDIQAITKPRHAHPAAQLQEGTNGEQLARVCPADLHTFESYTARKHIDELDGLRALCVLMVVSTHMADRLIWKWISGGLGVSIFFVLSGYLITMLALREEGRTGSVSLKAFYIRRTFRILPIYYFVLVGLCVLVFWLGWGQSLRENFREAVLSYLFYFQDVQFAREVALRRESPFAHSWSLGIEEKFYLIWPLAAFVFCRGRRSLRIGVVLLLALLFASVRSIHRLPGVSDWHLDVVLFSYFHISLGCLVALLLENGKWFSRLQWLGKARWLCVMIGLLLLVQLAYRFVVTSVPETQIAYGMIVACLLAGIVVGKGRVQRALRWKPLVFVGSLSYGMYLVHGLGTSVAQSVMRPGSGRPEISVAAYALACGLTVGIAYLLAVFIERPLIGVGKKWSQAIIARKVRRAGCPEGACPSGRASLAAGAE
jgi:peptidoglycan/LPS O-acetylase OafA/YrhL